MRRFTELLGFDVLGGFASFADAGFLWGSSWRLGVDSLEERRSYSGSVPWGVCWFRRCRFLGDILRCSLGAEGKAFIFDAQAWGKLALWFIGCLGCGGRAVVDGIS